AVQLDGQSLVREIQGAGLIFISERNTGNSAPQARIPNQRGTHRRLDGDQWVRLTVSTAADRKKRDTIYQRADVRHARLNVKLVLVHNLIDAQILFRSADSETIPIEPLLKDIADH